jgi:transposase-like protein
MRKHKVAKHAEVIKGSPDLVRHIRDRVCGLAEDILQGARISFDQEFSDIALFVIQSILDYEIEQVAGSKHEHSADRIYTRWGNNPGSVIINGRKVFTPIPRVVDKESKKAYRLKGHGVFQKMSDLAKRAYGDLIRGISSRTYHEGVTKFLEGYGVSSSSISRRMVEATAEKVKELMNRKLHTIDCCILMIDGIVFGTHTVIIAIGIDTKGVKHVLGLWQGATENVRVTKSVLEDIIERGLQIDRPMLVVIDGSKALRRAVMDVLGEDTPVQRCTVHKKRNVLDQLSDQDKKWVRAKMTKAYQMESAEAAERALTAVAIELELINPSSARSLREGLSETLTLHRLGVPQLLRTTVQSTNLIESVNAVVRQRTRNVKNWQNGDQVERWAAAGLLEAEKQFRRIRGYQTLPMLIDALATIRMKKHQAV